MPKSATIIALEAEYGPLLGDCAGIGHKWKFIGARACEHGMHHSHSVHVCEVCGDCDYGDSDEAREECEQHAESELCYL